MSNNFDGWVILDTLDTSTLTVGFAHGRADGTMVPSGPVWGALNVDPSAGAGVEANLGSVITRYTAANVQLWQKTGAGDTAWTQLGNLSGSVTLTAVSTTGTNDFQWTMADNQPAAVSFGASGALDMLVFDSTNGAEQVVINAVDGLKLADGAQLILGTGDDVQINPDGTDAVVTGTGDLVLGDDFVLAFGATKDWEASLISASNRLDLLGLDVTAGGATAATAALRIISGDRTKDDADANVPGSGALTFSSGATSVTAAATGGASGIVSLFTGSTDSTDAGGTGGDTGAIQLQTGQANSTAGTSGNSGSILLTTGASADGNTGNITLTTGTAGGARGVLDINAATIDLVTQATLLSVIDNSATSLTISQGANLQLGIDTTNGAEAITVGNTTTNPQIDLSQTRRAIKTDGIDFGDRYVLVEEFQQRPQLAGSIANNNASKTWEVAGTNAADAGAVFFTGGGIELTTAGTANDQEIIIPNTTGADNSQSPWQGTQWNTSNSPIMKANVRVSDTANTRLGVGLKIALTTLDTGTDADQVWLGYDSGGALVASSTNWVAVVSINGTDTQTDTGVAVAGGNYRMVIAVDGSRVCRFYINGALVHTTAALTASVTTLKPFAGVQTLAGAGRVFIVQRIACSRAY